MDCVTCLEKANWKMISKCEGNNEAIYLCNEHKNKLAELKWFTPSDFTKILEKPNVVKNNS